MALHPGRRDPRRPGRCRPGRRAGRPPRPVDRRRPGRRPRRPRASSSSTASTLPQLSDDRPLPAGFYLGPLAEASGVPAMLGTPGGDPLDGFDALNRLAGSEAAVVAAPPGARLGSAPPRRAPRGARRRHDGGPSPHDRARRGGEPDHRHRNVRRSPRRPGDQRLLHRARGRRRRRRLPPDPGGGARRHPSGPHPHRPGGRIGVAGRVGHDRRRHRPPGPGRRPAMVARRARRWTGSTSPGAVSATTTSSPSTMPPRPARAGSGSRASSTATPAARSAAASSSGPGRSPRTPTSPTTTCCSPPPPRPTPGRGSRSSPTTSAAPTAPPSAASTTTPSSTCAAGAFPWPRPGRC